VEGNREGQAWLLRECEQHGIAVQREDAYTYAQSSKGMPAAREELAACNAAGLDADWEEDADVPFPYRGGVRLADQAQFDPMPFLDKMINELGGAGGGLAQGEGFRGIWGGDKALRRPWPVGDSPEEGAFDPRQCVLATGIPILDRGGYFARLKPARSYCVAFY